MSFRGRGGGGGGRGYGGGGYRGGGGGRGGGRGGGGGGFRGGRGGGGYNDGPPDEVIEVGEFTHTCEDDIVCKCTCGKIPFFNAPIYFQNKEKIGKIDEIFGSLLDNGFSVTLSDGVKAASFKLGQKLFIDPAKLMPIERFLPGSNQGGRGRGGRGGRGGGDRGRGGRGGDRGGGFRGGRGGYGGDKGGRGGRGGFGNDRGGYNRSGNDRGSRGGFGNDRGGRGGFGNDRGGRGGFGGDRHSNDRGVVKRSFEGGSGGSANKRIKFDDD